jgi:hypothetical protein
MHDQFANLPKSRQKTGSALACLQKEMNPYLTLRNLTTIIQKLIYKNVSKIVDKMS